MWLWILAEAAGEAGGGGDDTCDMGDEHSQVSSLSMSSTMQCTQTEAGMH